MPSEQEFRAGLRDLAEGGQASTEADLATARDLGRGRRRARRTRIAAVGVVAVLAGIGAWFVLTGDGSDSDTIAGPTPTEPDRTTITTTTEEATTTTWSPPPDDPTAPSPAAVEADRAGAAVPEGYEDCGHTVTTSGWPTTVIRFGASACIVEAAAAGTPAQYTVSARNFEGGMTGARFRVEPTGEIEVWEYDVDQDGGVIGAARPCTAVVDADLPPPVCE